MKTKSEEIDEEFTKEMINYALHHIVKDHGVGHINFKNLKQYIKDWISVLYEDFLIGLSEEQVRAMCSKKTEQEIRNYCQTIIMNSFER